MEGFQVHPIGKVRVNEEVMAIVIDPKYVPALQALDGFSHLNVFWWFSDCDSAEARETLQTQQPYQKAPPVMGVFATRSPIRPNPIALTTAQVTDVDFQKGVIKVGYIHANDRTPVLDIKPYTPSIDTVESPTTPEWCSDWPKSMEESATFAWESVFNF